MSGKRDVTTRGVVIGRRAAGEGSARIFLYTEALGLVSAVARSAREERSKLRSHLQWGTRGTFTLVQGAETWRVTGALHTSNIFFELSHTPHREAAARVLNVVRQFVHGEGADNNVFTAFSGFLETLPRLSLEETKEAEVLTLLRILSALGYVRPDASITAFLSPSYDASLLARAQKIRPRLVQTINDGIAASGL